MQSPRIRPRSGLAPAVLLLAGTLAAQTLVPSARLADETAVREALDVGQFTVQTLDVPARPGAALDVPVILGGEHVVLELTRHSVRSPDYKLFVVDATGQHEVAPGPERTFRGHVAGVPGSTVSASIFEGRLDAVVDLGDGQNLWGIQSGRTYDAALTDADHIVFSGSDQLDRGYTCEQGPAFGIDGAPTPSSGGAEGGPGETLVCEIACDADVEFYNSNGSSVGNTEADITNIINRCSNIYEPDAGIIYEITAIIVRTSNPDPYTTNSPGGLLDEFQSEWNFNQGGIQRDVAHLFTGKNLSGTTIGIASLNVICNLFSAYGLSQSKFSGSLVSRTGLTAHELGHNWSAPHCNSVGDCRIMCSGLGGCTGILTSFGQASKNSIINKKNSSNCLESAVPPPPPIISSVFPPSVSPLGGDQITVDGVGLGATKEVVHDGTTLLVQAGEVQILSDTQVRYTAPVSTQLGDVDIELINNGGTSNTLQVEIVAVDPPIYTGPTLVILVFDPVAKYTWASDPSDTVFWIFSLSPATAPVGGFDVLSAPAFPITFLPSNAAGVGELAIEVPLELSGQGLVVYTQAAFFNGGLQHVSPDVVTNIL